MIHILAECGALKGEGPEGPPRERRASGVSCRVRRPFGQLYTKVAVFALPTDAAGTKGGFEGETASIVAAKITLRRC